MESESQKQRTPEEILAEFERDTTSHWPRQRAMLIRQAIPLFEAQGRYDEAQQAKWEVALFLLHRRELGQGKALGERFEPMMQFNGGEIPDPANFTEEAFHYYEKRLNQSNNPILRSWYADFLWERKHNHIFAREAVWAHHACYPIYAANEWWKEAADSLVRPLRLALRLKDADLIQQAKSKVFAALDDLLKRHSHPEVRYCLELIDAVLELSRRATNKDLEKVLEVCQSGAKFYASEVGGRNYYMAREFASREATLQNKLGQEGEADAARVCIGQYLEDEAELKSGASNLAGALFLQEAVRHYANIGRSDKVEELKIKVRERYQAAVEGGEFKEVSSEVKIPVEDIENGARELLKHGMDKALLHLAIDPSWIPDIDHAREWAQHLKKKFPLQSLFPRATIKGARQVHRALSQEEIDEANTFSQYNIDAGLRSVYLRHTFKVFIDEGGLNALFLIQYLSGSPLIENDILEVVSVGVERYFEKDYVSALHIFVPKLEETLRRTIGKLGISTTSQDSDGFTREKPLDVVLETPELKKLLGERSVFYFGYMLNHQLGKNLRNNVAHGLLTKAECTEELTEEILHLYLLLMPFEAKTTQKS